MGEIQKNRDPGKSCKRGHVAEAVVTDVHGAYKFKRQPTGNY